MGVCFVDLLDSVGLLIVLFVVWVGWCLLVCWFVVVRFRLVGCVRAFGGGFCGFACMLWLFSLVIVIVGYLLWVLIVLLLSQHVLL